MTISIQSPKRFSEIVAQKSSEIGARLIQSNSVFLTEDGPDMVRAAIEPADFVSLLDHAKPLIIYYCHGDFNSKEDVLEKLGIEDVSEIPSRAKALIGRWKRHDGEPTFYAYAFPCQGVLVHGMCSAQWSNEFDEALEELAEELSEELEAAHEKEKAARLARFASNVQTLMADPRFTASKVGIAKRTVLAKHLFPDLASETIREIVEIAEAEHWLATAAPNRG